MRIVYAALIPIIAVVVAAAYAQQHNLVELTPRQLMERKQITQNRMLLLRNTIDTNSNGVLSCYEIENAATALISLDKDNNGTLSPQESHGGLFPTPEKIRQDWVFNFIDDDGDITISAGEISNAASALRQLDKDGDWKLTLKELEQTDADLPAFFGQPPQFKRIPEWGRLMQHRNNEDITDPILPGADKRAFDGYTFYFGSYGDGRTHVQKEAFLRDMAGNIVHQWRNQLQAPDGVTAYLLDNGLLLRSSSRFNWKQLEAFPTGAHGVVQLVNWDSEVIWSYDYCKLESYCLHHDLAPLPNGNILALVFDLLTYEEAAAMGWQPQPTKNGVVYSERLIEIEPNLGTGGTRIVWQWDSRDHLIQDLNPAAWNYGDVARNPRKIDPNFVRMSRLFIEGQLFHLNSVDYSPELDQILLSSATQGEIWIIDHSISTELARGPAGDLLYRYGNPAAHRAGSAEDQILYWQHDAHWIRESGEIQIFNNGAMRDADGKPNPQELFLGLLDGAYSDIIRLIPPLPRDQAEYDFNQQPEITWHYNADASENFYSPFMSSARRLPNGNVFMVQSHNNRIVEVTAAGERVLDYQIPDKSHLFRVYKFPRNHPAFTGRLN